MLQAARSSRAPGRPRELCGRSQQLHGELRAGRRRSGLINTKCGAQRRLRQTRLGRDATESPRRPRVLRRSARKEARRGRRAAHAASTGSARQFARDGRRPPAGAGRSRQDALGPPSSPRGDRTRRQRAVLRKERGAGALRVPLDLPEVSRGPRAFFRAGRPVRGGAAEGAARGRRVTSRERRDRLVLINRRR